MATEKTTTDTGATGPSLLTVVTGGIGLACVAVVASLARWSQSWPHSDMRQIWANGLTGLSGVIGLVTIVVAFRRLDGRRRLFLLGLAVAAAVVGLLGGFELLRASTADLR